MFHQVLFLTLMSLALLNFVDAKSHIVVLPKDAHEDYVLEVERNYKRSTLVRCISLDGTTLKPLMAMQNKRIEKKLINDGYNENNVVLYYQENGFINSEIFAF